ncbi:MAG TPA: response regulator transcription factor [Candidatus Dormibacteraeota bacterium]|nr:response regulator transcription factor [Candidatus Dormibacteraeota bacterium]
MIHALIADDHAVVRRGLKELLTDSGRIAVDGEASTARETLEKVRERDWDILILDINLPDRSGLDILRDVKDERPNMPVLILTVCSEDQFAIRALRSGASGYLTKESAPGQLVDAVQKLVAGGRYISTAVAERLALHVGGNGNRPPQESLSDREHQVFRMLASGKTVSQIAVDMNLSVKTISTYRGRVLDKMGMRTNAELTYYAVRNQLVD